MRLCLQVAELLAERLFGLPQLLALLFELLPPDHLGEKHIQEALLLAIKLRERLAEGVPTGLQRLGQPVSLLRTGEFMRIMVGSAIQEAELTAALTHVLMLLRTKVAGMKLGMGLLLHDDPSVWRDPHATFTAILNQLQTTEDIITATRVHFVPRLG